MPESCTDRPTKAHETILLLSKRPTYYYDADAVREEAEYGYCETRGDMFGTSGSAKVQPRQYDGKTVTPGTGGTRNKRTVWTVATAPYSGAHFATFPPKLIEPCILAGANDRACAACGKAWRRVVERTSMVIDRSKRTHSKGRTRASGTMLEPATSKTIGHEPDCKCGTTETRPSIVLDPFMGSGTTAEVARKHGCHAIGIELNAEYIDMAEKRLSQGVLEFTA